MASLLWLLSVGSLGSAFLENFENEGVNYLSF